MHVNKTKVHKKDVIFLRPNFGFCFLMIYILSFKSQKIYNKFYNILWK